MKTTFVALAVGAVVVLASSAGLANTKGPSGPVRHGNGAGAQSPYPYHHHHGGPYIPPPTSGTGILPMAKRCYYLPAISGGTVTGLDQVCN
jgi:hypothetical protein